MTVTGSGSVSSNGWTIGSANRYYTNPSPLQSTAIRSTGGVFLGGWSPGVETTIFTSPALGVPTNPGGTLSPFQMDRLMHGHTFIEMEGSKFCLFCYALGVFRTGTDHMFVISEE